MRSRTNQRGEVPPRCRRWEKYRREKYARKLFDTMSPAERKNYEMEAEKAEKKTPARKPDPATTAQRQVW